MPTPKPKVLRSATFANEFMNDLQWRIEHPELSRLWSSGLKDWDHLIGGVGRGWYIVIVAKQKGGKTGLLGSLSINLNKQNVNVLTITLEMHTLQMGARIFANVSGVSMTKLRDVHTLSDEDMTKLIAAHGEISNYPGYWNYGARDFADIKKLILALQPDVVVLDYLGLVDLNDPAMRSRYQEITKLSREIKALTLPAQYTEGMVTPEMMARENLILAIEGQRHIVGDDETQKMLDYLHQKWTEYDGQSPILDGYVKPLTIITAMQTSKQMQRSGQLDETSPKDSQAPFEDCDLGIVINDLMGQDKQPLPHMRAIGVVATRVCPVGEFNVGYNASLARMYDENYFQTDNANSLRRQHGEIIVDWTDRLDD